LFDSHGSWSYVSIDDYNRFMGISINNSVTEAQPVMAEIHKIRAEEKG
jgi:ABC-type Zn uptake system ZnuABC Zn-binding protein ZnuA